MGRNVHWSLIFASEESARHLGFTPFTASQDERTRPSPAAFYARYSWRSVNDG